MIKHNTLLPLLLSCVLTIPAVAQNDIDAKAREDAAAAVLAASAGADTTAEGWKRSGIININMTQVSLSNWAAGGFSSMSGIAMFNGTANWKRGRKAWDNSIVLAFGGQLVDNTDPIKTDDRIELNSKYGYALKKSLYLSGLFQFRTQFTEGFNEEGIRISNFLAPSYTLLGLGLDHRPNDNFSVFFSPAMARLITVTDEKLFGNSTDPTLRIYGVENGNTTAFEFGGYLRFQYKTELAKNITFLTRGDFFSNYLRNPQNIDVTWETLFTFKVNEWFAATLNTLLIYDHDTQLPKLNPEGLPYLGPATQFKETLGVGLSFKL